MATLIKDSGYLRFEPAVVALIENEGMGQQWPGLLHHCMAAIESRRWFSGTEAGAVDRYLQRLCADSTGAVGFKVEWDETARCHNIMRKQGDIIDGKRTGENMRGEWLCMDWQVVAKLEAIGMGIDNPALLHHSMCAISMATFFSWDETQCLDYWLDKARIEKITFYNAHLEVTELSQSDQSADEWPIETKPIAPKGWIA